jgi:hypothetical protein
MTPSSAGIGNKFIPSIIDSSRDSPECFPAPSTRKNIKYALKPPTCLALYLDWKSF